MWNIAHRGASGHAPENTLAAFKMALEMGAQFIETDLQMTRDARIVAMHDATVNRTTNGRGQISKMSLAEMRGLDAGAWFLSDDGRSFKGERVPILDEILNFSQKADVPFYLELKPSETWGMELSMAGALQKSGEISRAVVISFDAGVLLAMRRASPMVMMGLLAERPTEQTVMKAVEIGARQLLPKADAITPELVATAKGQGLGVVAWTVNEPTEMRALMAMGVDGIITDYPDRLKAILSA
ncbi:MAG TPA: glycerophosphodiester phosphodiesterase family protein [Candidatus Acidoferrales bacterium]|nr:glycerophosphodiester phosphodiesterase family protein [Candidatus Acidoferrales bacterium]